MNTITLNDHINIRQNKRGVLEAQLSGCPWEAVNTDSFEFFALGMFRRLLELSWIPITERMPTKADANEYGDVDWSDGKDLWEAHYTEPREATHWRRIVLP